MKDQELKTKILSIIHVKAIDGGERHEDCESEADTLVQLFESELANRERVARIDGRKIQAEATLDKWQATPDNGDFTTFLYGQVAAHRYEYNELQNNSSKGET